MHSFACVRTVMVVSPLSGFSEALEDVGDAFDQAVTFPDHAVAVEDKNVRLPSVSSERTKIRKSGSDLKKRSTPEQHCTQNICSRHTRRLFTNNPQSKLGEFEGGELEGECYALYQKPNTDCWQLSFLKQGSRRNSTCVLLPQLQTVFTYLQPDPHN